MVWWVWWCGGGWSMVWWMWCSVVVGGAWCGGCGVVWCGGGWGVVWWVVWCSVVVDGAWYGGEWWMGHSVVGVVWCVW